MAESSRNSVRQARRDGNDRLKKMEKDKEISQDDEKRGHDEIQKLHDHYIGEINGALEAKEADILQVWSEGLPRHRPRARSGGVVSSHGLKRARDRVPRWQRCRRDLCLVSSFNCAVVR